MKLYNCLIRHHESLFSKVALYSTPRQLVKAESPAEMKRGDSENERVNIKTLLAIAGVLKGLGALKDWLAQVEGGASTAPHLLC